MTTNGLTSLAYKAFSLRGAGPQRGGAGPAGARPAAAASSGSPAHAPNYHPGTRLLWTPIVLELRALVWQIQARVLLLKVFITKINFTSHDDTLHFC